MQDSGYGLPRIRLSRTRVNRARRRAEAALRFPGPYADDEGAN